MELMVRIKKIAKMILKVEMVRQRKNIRPSVIINLVKMMETGKVVIKMMKIKIKRVILIKRKECKRIIVRMRRIKRTKSEFN